MKLKIATLNFSGINVSPFEYYDGTEQLEKLNQIYKRNLNHFKPGVKAWEFKRLDPTYTSKRQSIVFDQLQLAHDKTLPNQVQWQQIWRKRYNDYFKQGGTYLLDQNQVQNAVLFDYILYITICQLIYEDKQIQANFKNHNANTLLQYLKKMKNRPSSISSQKGQMLLQYLKKQDLDILFLQQASSFNWQQQLKKHKLHFHVKKNQDSVIIYKKQSVGQEIEELNNKYGKQLNFNEDSVSLFSNKNFLLISGHLKSNKQVNQKQILEIFTTIPAILKENQNLKLIIGIDANNFIQKIPENCKVNIIPTTKDVPTTIKKRTSMQQQLHKADELVSQVKDHIITNLQFEKDKHGKSLCLVQKVNGQQYLKELLPNDSHPYDHLIVRTNVQI